MKHMDLVALAAAPDPKKGVPGDGPEPDLVEDSDVFARAQGAPGTNYPPDVDQLSHRLHPAREG